MEHYSFGYWLRLKRKALDLTQQKLADQVGYSAAAIRKLEAEERRPSTQLVERLAELFAIPASERTAFLRFARGDWQAAPDEALDARPWRTATSLPAANGRNSVSAVGSQAAVSWPVHTAHGRFVGREWETAVAHTLWQQAMSGVGQALLISGEPGIGKTRLAQELMAQVERSRGQALLAECYAEGSAPYALVAQILEQLWHSGALASLNLPEYAGNGMLGIAPTLQPFFPSSAAEGTHDPQGEQLRLLDSVLTLLTRLTAHTPLLLVIDDAHWADDGSLMLLCHLARRSRALRLLLVLTCREVELNEARALNKLLFDLQRKQLATRLPLSRLTLAETRDLLATLIAEETTPDLLQDIYQKTEGNPFFVVEGCKALLESRHLARQNGYGQRPPDMAGMDIPPGVCTVIESRVTPLPEMVQDVLRLAAVIGHKFEFDLLRQAANLDEEGLMEALEQAERAQLIHEVDAGGGGAFSFTHGLIPAVLVAGWSGVRRRRQHRRVASLIAERRPDDHKALAHPYAAAANGKRPYIPE